MVVLAAGPAMAADKRVLAEIEDANTELLLDLIMKLPLKRYENLLSGRWKKGLEMLERSDRMEIGVVAHDAAQVVPSAVRVQSEKRVYRSQEDASGDRGFLPLVACVWVGARDLWVVMSMRCRCWLLWCCSWWWCCCCSYSCSYSTSCCSYSCCSPCAYSQLPAHPATPPSNPQNQPSCNNFIPWTARNSSCIMLVRPRPLASASPI